MPLSISISLSGDNIWLSFILVETPGTNVMNKFLYKMNMLFWNKALWLDVGSYMTSFNQLDCFISAKLNYAKICLWHRLQSPLCVKTSIITELAIPGGAKNVKKVKVGERCNFVNNKTNSRKNVLTLKCKNMHKIAPHQSIISAPWEQNDGNQWPIL